MTTERYSSHTSVFKITDTGGTLRDISANIVSIRPSFSRKFSEKTVLGASHEQSWPGIKVSSFDLELVYNETADTGTDTVLGPLLEDTTARAYEYYPRGTSGKKYYGTCYVENYQPITVGGEEVGATCTVRCVTRTRA